MKTWPWLAGACALALLAPGGARAAHANALWRVVHLLCVPDKAISGLAAPCMAVDRARGYAVIRDPDSRTQVVLAPTRRVRGIESPSLLTPGSPNYWQFAWEARRYFEARARRTAPRDMIGMAINSVYGRTQNQLHIHIDCVRPDVRATLKADEAMIRRTWGDLPVGGRVYRVRRVEGADLGTRDPFKLLAAGDPAARADMGRETLAVIGAVFADGRPGFVLLATQGGTPDNPKGSAEELLDHGCTVLSAGGAAAQSR